MSTDDHMETITDPAAIRATDEPDERGDFPCCATPAPASGVGLDLDAIEAAALADDGWWSVPVLALVAEVRRLTEENAIIDRACVRRLDQSIAWMERADSAEAEVVTLRARLAEAEALHWKVGGACSHCSQRSDYAVAWPCETAVALAGTTGEGQ